MKKLLLVAACSVWSVLSFAQLQAPVLTGPADSSSIVDVNIRLTWNPSIGGVVTGYDAEIDTDSNFTNPVSLPITGTSAKTSELDYGQVYYWRARGKNSSGTSAWSNVWSFTTFNSEFVLTAPNNLTYAKLYLTWDSVSGTSNYLYQISTDSTFVGASSVSFPHPPPITQYQPEDGAARAEQIDLMFGTKYFWRVKAVHSKDQSDWSNTRTFTVRDKFTLSNPADSTAGIDPRRKLVCACNPGQGVIEFRFQISDSLNFDPNSPATSIISALAADFPGEVNAQGALVFNDPVNVFTSSLEFGKTYHWRVQGVHGKDVSDWSDIRTFTVLNEPTLQKPTDGAIGVKTKSAEFHWKKIAGVDDYEVNIDEDINFSGHHKIHVPGDVDSVLFDLQQWDVPYFWRVRASHAKDESDWSDTWTFNATPTGIEAVQVNFGFSLYPNPAENAVNIDFQTIESGQAVVQVFTMLGEKLDQRNIGLIAHKDRIEYDVSKYEAGVYFIVVDMNGERLSRRLTIK